MPWYMKAGQSVDGDLAATCARTCRVAGIEAEEFEYLTRDLLAVIVRADHVVAVLEYDAARVKHRVLQERCRAQAR